MSNKYIKLIVSIVICLSPGIIGSLFTTPAINSWYVQLEKPFFNPPNWIFGPTWTSLYILMGISLWLVWNKRLNDRFVKSSIIFFIIHLVFNATWSIIFFGFKDPGLALVNIIILLIMILMLIFLFYQINKQAAYLLIPYILWVSFATILNYNIWILNI